MILDIDVGNTFLKWRCSGEGPPTRGRLLTERLHDGMPESLPDQVQRVRVASVAGPVVAALITGYCQARWGLKPEFARSSHQAAGVINSYADPSRMGVDRWLAMLAGFNLGAGACCVVDCGSAITIDFVTADGRHDGGYIVPGLRLMAKSLLANTAEVVAEREIAHFDLAPGRDTASAVFHGVNFVFDAIQRQLIERLDRDGGEFRLLITGGDGELFQRLAGRGEYRPELVMDGLEWAL
ncbi:type III pantothenate kinase [Marinobacterium nitratireducens]|uniref:Type III pantothenate kinase n=1 Tax=Marinobacterium nitratireducens TaxID=518897 RepID=A0A918DX19_9GAMM|nr:type III pantothenate kinase [Marinobacterium nitratireducens]GGO87687.1 type III pantothenate kinase [Marinobacterium nitratireducens]